MILGSDQQLPGVSTGCRATGPSQEIVWLVIPLKTANYCLYAWFFVQIKQTRYDMLISEL